MKKLCAYLTLFVLSIICFAQPAAAQTSPEDNGYRYILSGGSFFGNWNNDFNGNGGMERQSDGSFVTKRTWTPSPGERQSPTQSRIRHSRLGRLQQVLDLVRRFVSDSFRVEP